MSQTVGEIDGTHIGIDSHNGDSKTNYFDRKQMYSISTQAVAGGNLKFFDIATGYRRNIRDGRILRDPALYIQADRNILLTEPTDAIDGYNSDLF